MMDLSTAWTRYRLPMTLVGTLLLSGLLALLVLVASPLLSSLFAKTFAILASQLLITWLTTYGVIETVRQLNEAGAPGISSIELADGRQDLQIDWSYVQPYFWAGVVLNIGLFIALLTAGSQNLLLGILVFTLWSMLTGLEIALALLRVDESLGARVVGMAALLTTAATLVGIFTGFHASWAATALFIGLVLLLLGMCLRLLISIERSGVRGLSFFGVTLFVFYLLVDFGRLADLAENQGVNSWPAAMHLAIGVYLDVVNLVFFLLDLLSD